MRAVIYDAFGAPPAVRDVPDPAPPAGGAVIRVDATGLCRSDWHGWRGHDPDIRPAARARPRVRRRGRGGRRRGRRLAARRPGHRAVRLRLRALPPCLRRATSRSASTRRQPGFTHWGSFAEFVAVEHADVNLVRLPDGIDDAAAASLGCRFATAYRAVVAQGRVRAGEWVAVHGCGGVGLSAVMIAAAAGARVVAVDVIPGALELARAASAPRTRRRAAPTAARGDARTLTGGGAHLSLDALGSRPPAPRRSRACAGAAGTCRSACCRRRRAAALPMDRVIAYELELLGSHGMPAHAYPEMLALVTSGRLRPGDLVTGTMTLDGAPAALSTMDKTTTAGIRLITPW